MPCTVAVTKRRRKNLVKLVKKLARDKRAVTALEYALIAALVAGVIIGGVSLLGTNVSKVFSTIAKTI